MLAVQTPGGERHAVTIRAGGRIPVTTGGGTTNYDVGTNIDANSLRESQSEISLHISADLSTLVQDTPGTTPVVRQNRWSGNVLVPVKKPTLVFASDDPASRRQLQLELTATPLK
jgi:hypothetical protein